MEWKRWKNFYFKIISDFGYDPEKDYQSALILNNLLKIRKNSKKINTLKHIIRDRIVFIFGCGPSLPYHLELLKSSNLNLKNYIYIAADGATTALMKYDILPDIVVTDLDGQISDQIQANKEGTLVIIHAHGDNINQIQQFYSNFEGDIMGSTQNKPLSHIFNFGGFTDGDRCVFLATELKASIIILLGFDFGNVIGKFSKPFLVNDEVANDLKIKKLDWAQKLLSELSNTTRSLIIKVDSKKPELGKIQTIEFEELVKYLNNKEQDRN